MNANESTMSNRKELAQFQASLLELFATAGTVAEAQQRLAMDDEFKAFRDYVARFDPAMISVAMELTKKWGVRSKDA